MNYKSPLWVSITRNAYNQNSGTPEITRGTLATKPAKCDDMDPPDEITGLRSLPTVLVVQIFLIACHESSATRRNLTRICQSWRNLALSYWKLWSPLLVSKNNRGCDEVVFTLAGSRARYWGIPVHIQLESPSALQLLDLISFAPTTQWESLHIRLGSGEVDASIIDSIFHGSSLLNLKSIHIEEKRIYEEQGAEFEQDPYGALYDAIFLTANKLEEVYIDSDIKALAPQYGHFGQRVKGIGGSANFIANSLAVSSGTGGYPYVTWLSLYRWDFEIVKDLTIPNLRYLRVDHCLYDEDWNRNNSRPSMLLPSLVEIHLTAHSIPILSQVCAAGLEVLVVHGKDDEKWYEKMDGCLPPETQETHVYLSPIILDIWTTPNLERVEIRTPVDTQYLLTFLHNAKGLRDLTLAVPNEYQWFATLVGGMAARWGYEQHLAHCPQLELLTLLMDWDYGEGEWLYEIRKIFDARKGTPLRSIICRWTGDNRHPQSGPAGDFSVFGGEYYSAATEPELGPNLPSESKQVGAHTREEDEESAKDDMECSEYDDDWDEDDLFGSYDDIPFP